MLRLRLRAPRRVGSGRSSRNVQLEHTAAPPFPFPKNGSAPPGNRPRRRGGEPSAWGHRRMQAGWFFAEEEIIQILIHAHIDQMPVIKPRALHGLQIKTQRLHQMQSTASGGRGPRNLQTVAEFRLYQYNMQHTKNSLPAVFRQAETYCSMTERQILNCFSEKNKAFSKKISFCCIKFG